MSGQTALPDNQVPALCAQWRAQYMLPSSHAGHGWRLLMWLG